MGGKIAMLGIPSGKTPVDWNAVIFKALTIKGIYGREMFETWYKMIAMLQSGLDVRKVITHRMKAARFRARLRADEAGLGGQDRARLDRLRGTERPMSHTRYDLRRQRLQRSELAVPGSSPKMIERAADSEADYVFLDIEDAVAPADKEQARANIIKALNEIDWRASGKTICVRINGIDTHYMYRDLVDVMEQAGHRLDTILVPKVGVPADLYLCEAIMNQIEMAQGIKEPVGLEALIETALGMANVEAIARDGSRRLEAHAFRRRRLRRLQQGPHREHRRAQSRLSGRPVARRAVAHDGRVPRLRAAGPSTARSATSTIPTAISPPAGAPQPSASRANGPSIRARSPSPTRSSRPPKPRPGAPTAFSRPSKRPPGRARGPRSSTAR